MIILVISLLFILYTWLLYPGLLAILSSFRRGSVNENIDNHNGNISPVLVTVIIAAHNEKKNIEKRINNIFLCDYPRELIEVIVASDGSTDGTQNIVNRISLDQPNVSLIDINPQEGRSNAHNKAMKVANGQICIFTDAETVFESKCISTLVSSFKDETVGFASGVLRYLNQNSTAISQSAGLYWHFEMLLRKMESKLGVYVFGTGACCAVRTDLYQTIPSTGDVDFTTPLDVVLSGYSCVHVDKALAWDIMPSTPANELRARIRMTAKNLHGTVSRWGSSGIKTRPIYSLIIFSHKITRWLTPFAMITAFIGTILALDQGWVTWLLLFLQVVAYSLAICGAFGLRIPLSSSFFSFCLANIGFFLGVLKALFGSIPKAYKPINYD